MMPPSTASTPETIPATTPTSSRPDTCFAAMAQMTTGMAATRVSKTLERSVKTGIRLMARQMAMAMKAGRLVIIMPRKLIRFHILAWRFSAACAPVFPMTGR